MWETENTKNNTNYGRSTGLHYDGIKKHLTGEDILEIFSRKIRDVRVSFDLIGTRLCSKYDTINSQLKCMFGIRHGNKSDTKKFGFELVHSRRSKEPTILLCNGIPTEYMYSKGRIYCDRISGVNNEKMFKEKFGTHDENGNFNWVEKSTHRYFGKYINNQELCIDSNDNIYVKYYPEQDSRNRPSSRNSIVIAFWSANELKVKIESIFNQNGTFVCSFNEFQEGGSFSKIRLRKALSYDIFINRIRSGDIYLTNHEGFLYWAANADYWRETPEFSRLEFITALRGTDIVLTKKDIRNIFDNDIRGVEPDLSRYNGKHDGKLGHWLESRFGISANCKPEADMFGYEIKHTMGSVITFCDFSATEYMYTKGNHRYTDYGIRTRDDFITVFGTAKKDRYSWSGECAPKKYGEYSTCGQRLCVDEHDNIFIKYRYRYDERVDKDNIIPEELRIGNIVIAYWDSKMFRKKIESKFGQKGVCVCIYSREKKYFNHLHFGKPLSYEKFVEDIKSGEVYFDSGMHHGNNRNYSQWRAKASYWLSL